MKFCFSFLVVMLCFLREKTFLAKTPEAASRTIEGIERTRRQSRTLVSPQPGQLDLVSQIDRANDGPFLDGPSSGSPASVLSSPDGTHQAEGRFAFRFSHELKSFTLLIFLFFLRIAQRRPSRYFFFPFCL